MTIRLASSITLFLGCLLAAGTARADDDPRNVCEELHCYCDGPDEPDTVGSCDTTCDALCAGRSSGGGRPWAVQRFAVGGFAGAGSHVVDPAGGYASGTFTGGGDLRFIMGSKPLLGIELASGVMAASTGGPSGRETIAYVPLLVGLSSTPKLHRGKKSEIRLDLGADVGFLFGLSCDGCKVNAYGSQLRAGIDTYFGRDRIAGIALDVVYLPGHLATFDAGSLQIRPPTILFHLAIIGRKSALLW